MKNYKLKKTETSLEIINGNNVFTILFQRECKLLENLIEVLSTEININLKSIEYNYFNRRFEINFLEGMNIKIYNEDNDRFEISGPLKGSEKSLSINLIPS